MYINKMHAIRHKNNNNNNKKEILAHRQAADKHHVRRLRSSHTTATNSNTQLWPLFVLFLAQHILAVHGDWLMDCGDCHCKWNSGKKTADCKNLSLSAVPENLSPEVQVLDLSLNRITYLEQNAFLNADLHNLHKLYIRNSTLQQIDPRTFTQLEILIELDLSNNLLRQLQPNLFARLIKVRALVLNGNLLESLADGVFQNLKYLHKVELMNNRLVRIGTQSFTNVPLLSQIYLDGNRFNFLRKESFESVKRLTALSLDQNPWNCTCELQIFRDFVIKRNLYTPPTACYYPLKLRGMLWVEDQPEAFACKPKIIFPARGATITTSKENVTLICRVHASANTHIAWDYNKQLYRSNQHTNSVNGHNAQRVHIQLLRDELSQEKDYGRDVYISRLTIHGAVKSDDGVYTCLAENAAGKDTVQMHLVVEAAGPRDLLLQGNLFVVICLMALGLLSVSAFLALITCCLFKRFKAMNGGHHRHHHNHRHHHLHTSQQLTPNADPSHTQVTSGSDVLLSADDTSLNSLKQHKTLNHNGGMGGGGSALAGGVDNGGLTAYKEKYTELLKHGGKEHSLTVGGYGNAMDDMPGRHHQLLLSAGTDVQASHADKTYLERNNEEKLHIKYPHGIAAMDINTTINRSFKDDSKRANGLNELTKGRTTEFQPDLLPAYASKLNASHKQQQNEHSQQYQSHQQQSEQQQQHQQQQQSELYSPLMQANRTINSHIADQQQRQSFATTLTTATTTQTQSQTIAKSKYNINVQEYLQAKYGTVGKTKTKTSQAKKLTENPTKREAPSIPLTTSASLTATSGYSSAITESDFGMTQRMATSPSSANSGGGGGGTLQRHAKSLATAPHTPTDTSNPYEYRQPPPPPYNASHRTHNNNTTSSMYGSGGGSSNSRTNLTLETANDLCAAATKFLKGDSLGMTAMTRQTIVTASPSLNFLTTTGGNVPQRQLL